jgi:AraC family transcriptional regulator
MENKALIPKLVTMEAKTLVGHRLSMSVANFRVAQLWRSFSPRVGEIKARLGEERYSVNVYELDYFIRFQPTKEYDKWAAVQVSDISNIPNDMEVLILPEGLYAVFHYVGLSSDNSIFQEIYGTWLPASDYELDDRPHFEVLGEKYKNNDPSSEEEIWIPIKKRS